jgi:fructose-bisphosphate aldolase class 1
MIDPALAPVLASLTDITARNAVGSIQTRVSSAKAKKQFDVTVQELSEIINQLVEDRVELIGIATTLREEVVAQRITEDDIKYITEKAMPALESIIALGGGENQEAVSAIKTLLSRELLTVLQLVGFNFKTAIGEPLTQVVQTAILKLASSQQPARQRQQGKK